MPTIEKVGKERAEEACRLLFVENFKGDKIFKLKRDLAAYKNPFILLRCAPEMAPWIAQYNEYRRLRAKIIRILENRNKKASHAEKLSQGQKDWEKRLQTAASHLEDSRKELDLRDRERVRQSAAGYIGAAQRILDWNLDDKSVDARTSRNQFRLEIKRVIPPRPKKDAEPRLAFADLTIGANRQNLICER